MKKYIFISVLFISVIALGQDTKYHIITNDIRFVSDTIIGGSHYCGWLNSKGKPTAIGTKQLGNNTNYKGEWANGLPTGFGYMTAPGTSYSGQIENAKMSGYGTLNVNNHSTSGLWKNNAIVENSLQFSSEGAVILSQGGKKQQPAREYYEKIFYETQKAGIKNKVQAQGVRYVEDFEITHKSDIYLYSGGWKDGKPFYYGAIKNTNSFGFSAYVKYGYINSIYTSGEYIGLPQFEGEYKEYSYDNGLISKELTDKGDTIFSQMTKYIRYLKVTNKNNDITQLDIVNTYNKVAIHSLRSSDSIGIWSICYEPNTLREGYVNRDGAVISIGERSIDTDGEFRENNTIRYANHSLFTVVDTLAYKDNITDILFGVYTQANKDYAIGYFTRHFQNSHKDYPTYLTPIAVKEYFSDGEAKRDILSSNRNYQRRGEPLANDQWQKRILKYCDIQRTPISGSATYNFSDGTVYSGEWLNHTPEGKGMMQYPNGDTYQGSFSQGKPNGEGKMLHINGDVFQGNFVQGLLDGEGEIQYANGNIYKGTFSKGTLNGEGIIQYADGSIYKGTFSKGVLNGEGMIQYADSDIYQGHISLGKTIWEWHY